MLRKIDLPKNIELEPLENPGAVSGFVSPAEDYWSRSLNIVQKIVKDPVNTYYFEADSEDMESFGIFKGSILVVDRSEKPINGSLVVCNLDGEWLNRQLTITKDFVMLRRSLLDEHPLITNGRQFEVFGVIRYICSKPNH